MDGAPGGSRHAGPGPGPGPSPSPPGGPRPAAAGGGGGGGGGSAWVAAPLCLLILLTLLGNGALVLLILSQRALRSTSNFLLASLFLADLLVGGVVMPPAMLSRLHGRWVLGGAFCPLWLAFDVMCSSASILHLGLISLDRYLLILSPLRYKRRMTPGRALLLVLAAWSLAALVSFWPLRMGWHQAGGALRPLNATAPEGEGEGECRLLVSLPYALVASGLTFFLPAVAILFTYCRILLAARRQALQVASLTSNVLSAADEPTEQVTKRSAAAPPPALRPCPPPQPPIDPLVGQEGGWRSPSGLVAARRASPSCRGEGRREKSSANPRSRGASGQGGLGTPGAPAECPTRPSQDGGNQAVEPKKWLRPRGVALAPKPQEKPAVRSGPTFFLHWTLLLGLQEERGWRPNRKAATSGRSQK